MYNSTPVYGSRHCKAKSGQLHGKTARKSAIRFQCGKRLDGLHILDAAERMWRRKKSFTPARDRTSVPRSSSPSVSYRND